LFGLELGAFNGAGCDESGMISIIVVGSISLKSSLTSSVALAVGCIEGGILQGRRQ